VKTDSEILKLWECPKCGRQFERKFQSHSCKYFPIEQHFIGKEKGENLFEKLKKTLQRQLGDFKIESLECCIHFVSTFTFAAVKIFKNKIRVDFSLHQDLKSKRIKKSIQMSANRYLYYIEIINEDEINDELIKWIQEAHDKKLERHSI